MTTGILTGLAYLQRVLLTRRDLKPDKDLIHTTGFDNFLQANPRTTSETGNL